MNRFAYPSDLSDDEWELLKPLIPIHQGVGHPQTVELREIVNAILYWADNGIKWRAMPHDFPPWSTVYDYYRRACQNWSLVKNQWAVGQTSKTSRGSG